MGAGSGLERRAGGWSHPSRRWTHAERAALARYWGRGYSVGIMALLLRRSESAVAAEAERLGLRRGREDFHSYRRWTEDEKRELCALLTEGRMTAAQAARELGRSLSSVKCAAYRIRKETRCRSTE